MSKAISVLSVLMLSVSCEAFVDRVDSGAVSITVEREASMNDGTMTTVIIPIYHETNDPPPASSWAEADTVMKASLIVPHLTTAEFEFPLRENVLPKIKMQEVLESQGSFRGKLEVKSVTSETVGLRVDVSWRISGDALCEFHEEIEVPWDEYSTEILCANTWLTVTYRERSGTTDRRSSRPGGGSGGAGRCTMRAR